MKIKKTKDGYQAESSSKKGKFYNVDPKKPWCDCEAFKFREMKRKGVCKHIIAVREYIEKKQQKTIEPATVSITEYLAEKGEADSIDLIKRFGEAAVDGMIKSGELIEKNGKITILK
jgi:predicted nucleic acid-binding Zn finger protein